MSVTNLTRRPSAWRIAVVLGSALATLAGTASAERLQGSVKHAVYTSPEKSFSVPVPQGLGMKVSDGYTKEPDTQFGAVSFHDDFGNATTIFYMAVGRERAEQMQTFDAEKFGKWLEAVAMPLWFLNVSPDSRIVHQAPTTFDDRRASAAQVRIPGGSPLVVTDSSGTSKRADSIRGLVFFVRGSYVYMLGTELGGGVFALGKTQPTPDREEPEPEGEWLKFVEGLKPFYQTIRFVD